MAGLFDIVTNVLGNVMLEQMGIREAGDNRGENDQYPEICEVDDVQELADQQGSVTTILGRPKTGKTIAARRIAEEIGLPVYTVSLKEKPPSWITPISFKDTETEPPPYSTLILDDALEYASISNYGDSTLDILHRNVFTVRHERKIHIIWCAQTSGLLDKYALASEVIVLKPPSILFEDMERPMVRKIQKRIMREVWDGKSDYWLKRHAFVLSHSWQGVVRVSLPEGLIQGN